MKLVCQDVDVFKTKVPIGGLRVHSIIKSTSESITDFTFRVKSLVTD